MKKRYKVDDGGKLCVRINNNSYYLCYTLVTSPKKMMSWMTGTHALQMGNMFYFAFYFTMWKIMHALPLLVDVTRSRWTMFNASHCYATNII